MSSVVQKEQRSKVEDDQPLSGNVAIEAVWHDKLDMTKLAQALELYMRHLTETADVTGDTPS